MTTPLRQPRRASRDAASATGGRRTPSQTRIPTVGAPMANSRSAANRQATTRPTYDFLAGGGSVSGDNTPPKQHRTTIRQAPSKPDLANEDLRAQVKTLQYELDALKQDKEVTRLRHEKELRDVQSKAEVDSKRAQASDTSSSAAAQKHEALARSLREVQDAAANKQHDLEKRLHAAQDEARSLRDEASEAQEIAASEARQSAYKLKEAESATSAAQAALSEAQQSLDAQGADLRRAQAAAAQKTREVGELESMVVRLRAATGDADELATVRRELANHVAHVRELERSSREAQTELRRLREERRGTALVEEEKRALELRLERAADIERELEEARFQRRRLEDERAEWAGILSGGADEDEGAMATDFDSPSAVARALAAERSQRAALAQRLGAVQAEFAEKETLIQGLEAAKKELKARLDKSRGGSSSAAPDRARARAERQKALAVREAEYLRAQLRTFEQEDATLDLDKEANEAQQQQKERVTQLEDLVAQYRSELDAAASELAHARTDQPPEPKPAPEEASKSLKRARTGGPSSEDEEEGLGALSRKNRKLAAELSSASARADAAGAELAAARTQIASLQEAGRTRVLALRSNPTADFERATLGALRTLRTENEGLHALLEKRGAASTVPRASLDALRAELDEERARGRDRDKRILRLKQSWAGKSAELRRAVASILGWNVVPAANGKFKLASIFNPGEDDGDEESGIGANHLVFDPQKGEMLVAGGPEGPFAREIKPLVSFWLDGRGLVPGLMAACTLEFCERAARDNATE